MTARRVFIDTNILLRATVAEADRHDDCYAALQKLSEQQVEQWINRQVLLDTMLTSSCCH